MLTLTNVLKINAISSGATGLLLVFFSRTIGLAMGTSAHGTLIATGIFLIIFAIFVFEVSLGRPANAKAVRWIIRLDRAWVAASAIVLIFLFSEFTVIGVAGIVAVAGWVLMMAYLQTRGLHHSLQNRNMQ